MPKAGTSLKVFIPLKNWYLPKLYKKGSVKNLSRNHLTFNMLLTFENNNNIYISKVNSILKIRWFIYILGKILIHTFFGWIHTLSSCVRLYADLIWVCLPHPPMFIWLRNLYYTIFSKYIIILLIPFHLDIRGVGQTHSNLICI